MNNAKITHSSYENPSNWKEILETEFIKNYFQNISFFIKNEFTQYKVYPPKQDIFNAFKYCDYDNIKIVILGMDPYIREGQAHGLSFSVNPGIKIPPSLQNIYKELHNDIDFNIPNHGYLKSWAQQGILLLNTSLTVREGATGSHMKIWEPFTKNIIKILNDKTTPLVFLLWGNHARNKRYLITNPIHCIIEGGHPSPMSCKLFFGGKYFSRTNTFLVQNDIKPIDWTIKNT